MHLSEEQLVMHYYGEPDGAGAATHLESCADCRSVYRRLTVVLAATNSLHVPEPPLDYGAQIWRQLAPALPARSRWRWAWSAHWRFAAAMSALLFVAFFAGRLSQRSILAPPPAGVAQQDSKGQVRERILLVAVGDYLERSQTVLVELANATPGKPLNLTRERQQAEDLLDESRLYRQTAAEVGDRRTAGVLDELERFLLEVAHSPASVNPAQLTALQQRLEEQGILFKVRILGNTSQQPRPANPARSTTL